MLTGGEVIVMAALYHTPWGVMTPKRYTKLRRKTNASAQKAYKTYLKRLTALVIARTSVYP